MNGTNRDDIKVGMQVKVVQKQDQRSGKLTDGIVSDILTKSPTIPTASKCVCKAVLSAGLKKYYRT